VRAHTPSRAAQPWGATSCCKAAPLTDSLTAVVQGDGGYAEGNGGGGGGGGRGSRDERRAQERTESLTRDIAHYAQQKQLGSAQECFDALANEGLTPSRYSYSNLINAFVNSGDVAGAEQLLERMRVRCLCVPLSQDRLFSLDSTRPLLRRHAARHSRVAATLASLSPNVLGTLASRGARGVCECPMRRSLVPQPG
jgi:pentatricopeptide repeat protein